ncbi:MAG: proprotein convertase P-domain-containing protein, partial [Flavobacteriales bacterium]|nr:proprotein convertase P-domain-containing protein [Flavobacteriales bacterium]
MASVLATLFGLLLLPALQAQTLTTSGDASFTGDNGVSGNGVITFVVENNSGGDVLLTDMESYWQTASNGAIPTLWASTVSLSGPYFPFNLPDWTQVIMGSPISVPANGYQPTLSGINYLIPNGATVRFLLESDNAIRYSGLGTSPGLANTFTNAGLTLRLGDWQIAAQNVGYGGLFSNTGNTPRFFTGTLNFIPAAACTGMPTAGTISGPSFVCSGGNANLQVNGSTLATGITRDWYSSNVPGGPYNTYIGSGITVNTGPVVSDMYYVCIVTCGPSSMSDQTPEFHLPATSGVSGPYTIDAGGGGDLLSFAEAISLLQCGISGPVTFDVAPGSGPYNERIVIPQVTGSSSTNTITINGNGETLQYSPSVSADRAAVLLDGADYVTIDDLVIDVSGGTYGFGVHLMNQADHNTISNCTIINPDATSSANYAGIVASSSTTSATGTGDNANFCTFDGNTILGCSGSYKLRLNGTSAASPAQGNQVLNNQLMNGYSYQAYIYYQSNCLVKGNDISRPGLTSTTTFYGVYLNGCESTTVDGNAIHNVNGTSTAYLYYITGSDPLPGSENAFQNNIVYDLNNTSTVYSLYNSGSDNARYYHNTILLDDQITTSGSAYGVYQTGAASGLEYFNNIIVISRSGTGTKRCLYFLTSTSTFGSNNNVLRMTSTGGTTNQVAYFNSTGYASLADWQASNGNVYDQASSEADPIFQDPLLGNLTPLSGTINDIGDPSIGALVPFDYVGTARPLGAAPDPGAFEFDPAACSQPAGTATVSSNCLPPNNNFGINVEVTDLGDGASVNIVYDDGNGPVTVGPFGLGTALIGPFPSGTSVLVTIAHESDGLCDVTLGSYTSDCPPVIDLSLGASCEDFENADLCTPSSCTSSTACTSTAFDPIGWQQDTSDDGEWSVDEGGTGSSSTGIQNATTGVPDYVPGTATGNYVYLETSSPCFGSSQTAILLSPIYDVSGLSNPNVRVQMAYAMYGQTMGTMSIDIEDPALSGNWTNLWSLSGDQGEGWFLTPELDYAYQNTSVRYRIVGVAGSDFYSDMAFDYFCVQEGPLCTAPTATATVVPSCIPNSEFSIDVDVTDLGSGASVDITYDDGNGPVTAGPFGTGIQNIGPFPSGASVNVVVEHGSDAACDVNLGDYTFTCPAVVSSFPYCEDFEAATNCLPTTCTSVLACTSTALDPVGWENATDDGNGNWSVDEGGTSSSATGIANSTTGVSDYVPGTPTGNYVYMESGSCAGNTIIANSPVFDVSGFTNPVVRAQTAYSMYGATMGTMAIDIEDPALSGSWTEIWTLTGDQGEGWYLTPQLDHTLIGTAVRYRVRGISGSSFTSDMAFDYFCVKEAPTCTNPVATTSTTADCGAGTFSVSVNITDLGDANTVSLVPDMGSPITGINSTGTQVLGPYPFGTVVSVMLNHDDNSDCNVDLGSFTGDDSDLGTCYAVDTYHITSSTCIDLPYCLSFPGTQLGVDAFVHSVDFVIAHTYHADLDISLTSPSGVTIDLTSDNGGTGDDYGIPANCPNDLFTLADNAGTPVTSMPTSDGVVGSFIPEQLLSTFHDGSDPNGIWVLHICDDAAGDEGDLRYFQINLVDCESPSATATVVDDCLNNQFTVEVNVLSTGNGATVDILTDLGGLAYDDVDGSGNPYVLGPFPPGAVQVTVAHASNPVCDLVIDNLYSTCPWVISNFPYCEDFENAEDCLPSTCTSSLACTSTSLLPVGWANSTTDGSGNWSVDEGGTSSLNTGIANATTGVSDYVPGTPAGKYVYMESGSCTGNTIDALSPLFDVTGMTTGKVRARMAYAMYGATMGTMSVEIEDPANSNNWTTLWSLSGDQGEGWFLTPKMDHTFTGPMVRYRVRGVSGSSFTSDMAFDYFCVQQGPLCDDPVATVTSVNSPDCNLGTFSIDVDVTSIGDATSVTVQYALNGGGWNNGCTLNAPGPCQIVAGSQDVVTIRVIHDQDGDCYQDLGDFVAPGTTCITCGDPAYQATYCYVADDSQSWHYVSDGGGTFILRFIRGTIESSSFDHVTIYDGPDNTYPVLFTNPANTGNLGPAGSAINSTDPDFYDVNVTATGSELYMEMSSDGSVQCATSTAYDPWEWEVICYDCTFPVATASVQDDCDNSQYYVTVDITDAGNLGMVDIVSDLNGVESNGNDVGAGMYIVGPYPNGTPVNLTLVHPGNTLCNYDLGLFTDCCSGSCSTAPSANVGINTNGDYDCGVPSNAFPNGQVPTAARWWNYNVPVDSRISVSACDPVNTTNLDTYVTVHEGPCNSSQLYGGDDDDCGTPTYGSTYTFFAYGGSEVQVEWDNRWGDNNGHDWEMTSTPCVTPPNNLCADANPAANPLTIATSPLVFNGNRDCAYKDGSIPRTTFAGTGGWVWESFQLNDCAHVTIDYCGSIGGTGTGSLNMYGDCGSIFINSQSYDFTTCGDGNLTIDFGDLQPGDYYYPVLWDENAGASGPYTLRVFATTPSEACPTNITCALATPITCNATVVGDVTNLFSSLPANACPYPNSPQSGGSLWYSYTAIQDENVILSTCGAATTFDTRISVFNGPDCNNLSCYALSDDKGGACTNRSQLEFYAQNGQTYWIAVHAPTPYIDGVFELAVGCNAVCPRPGNDDCTGAALISSYLLDGSGTYTDGDNSCAMNDAYTSCSQTANDQGMWYSFSSGMNSIHLLDLLAVDQDGSLTASTMNYAVFSGSCSGPLQASGEVDCAVDGDGYDIPLNGLTPGNDYLLYIYNAGDIGVEGSFRLRVQHPGLNDAGISLVNDPEAGLLCTSSITPQVELTNYGENTLTSVEIHYDMDGLNPQVYNWTGNLPYQGTEIVDLPAFISPYGIHTFNAYTALPNGGTDDIPSNDAAALPGVDVTGESVFVDIFTDNDPSGIYWEIYDANFTLLASAPTYTTPNSLQVVSACLTTINGNHFMFFLYDFLGDGLSNTGNGNGYWRLRNEDGGTLIGDNFDGTIDGFASPTFSPQTAIYVNGHEFDLPSGPS